MRPFEPDTEPIERVIDLTEPAAPRSLHDAVLLAIDPSGFVVDWQIEGDAVEGRGEGGDLRSDLSTSVG